MKNFFLILAVVFSTAAFADDSIEFTVNFPGFNYSVQSSNEQVHFKSQLFSKYFYLKSCNRRQFDYLHKRMVSLQSKEMKILDSGNYQGNAFVPYLWKGENLLAPRQSKLGQFLLKAPNMYRVAALEDHKRCKKL